MVAGPSNPTRSANAGELSPDAAGRVDIKQYYSAGLAYKNVEPVPQSGFRQMGGTRRVGKWRAGLNERAISSPSVNAGPHTGTQTVWTGTVAGTVAAVLVSGFDISAGTATFTVQALVSGVWTTVAGPFAVTDPAVAETRLAAFAPGEQKVPTQLRIQATFSTSSSVAISSVTAFFESAAVSRPRYVALTADDGTAYSCFVTSGIADIFTAEAGYVGSARLASVTAAMLPDLGFYAEAATIGIWHPSLTTVRLMIATPGQHHDWRQDLWPYGDIPKADLGGNYPKTSDVWEMMLRWSAATFISVSFTVDGEVTPAISLIDVTTGNPIMAGDPNIAEEDWHAFAAAMQTAIRLLPSLGPSVTVTDNWPGGGTRRFIITFGGALAGEEYDVSASVVNTADASILPFHTAIGKTSFEPIFSALRGWPGLAELYGDRMAYGRLKALSAALTLSRVGEYFNLNTASVDDAAARLDKLRSQTNETIVAIKQGTYLLVFTDRGVYFATNRAISRNDTINFVLASEIGAQPNCKPFDLDGVEYYVAISPRGISGYTAGGKQLVSLIYDDVSTKYNGDPVSLLATHLVDQIIRSARQRPETDLDASKGWLMRADGRLIAGQFIRNQEILGFCEWISAAAGRVREIGVDGKNRLWLVVERGANRTIELYDSAIYLQDAVSTVPDLAGVVSGLPFEDGATVYAVVTGGYALGPYTVTGGEISLGDAYPTAFVGRWQAPYYESMPQVHVTRNDQVIARPGRIHTANLHLMDTTSIAVGANGQPAEDVSLLSLSDPTDQPMPAKSGPHTVSGMLGSKEGTTLVITQTRPGTLRIRDYSMGASL